MTKRTLPFLSIVLTRTKFRLEDLPHSMLLCEVLLRVNFARREIHEHSTVYLSTTMERSGFKYYVFFHKRKEDFARQTLSKKNVYTPKLHFNFEWIRLVSVLSRKKKTLSYRSLCALTQNRVLWHWLETLLCRGIRPNISKRPRPTNVPYNYIPVLRDGTANPL